MGDILWNPELIVIFRPGAAFLWTISYPIGAALAKVCAVRKATNGNSPSQLKKLDDD